MDWEQYKKRFIIEAGREGRNRFFIKNCLKYAKQLYEKKLPIIYDQEHFSSLVGYEYDYILKASNDQKKFYRKFVIPKKAGGFREISEPLPSLKEIQRWILDNILYQCIPHNFCKAYIPKGSIKDNARFHRNQNMVLKLDIKDFFSSLKYNKVYNSFKKSGYRDSIAILLSNLTTLDKSLPQGSPTSAALSNLLCYGIDNRLSSFAIKENIRYTRYSDDLTFSGEFQTGQIIKMVSKVLGDNDLLLNEDKTRLMLKNKRQVVTGIVVNKKLQAPRYIRRELRKAIYYIKTFGLDSHIYHEDIKKSNYIYHLMGIANYILFVNADDKDAKEAIKILKENKSDKP